MAAPDIRLDKIKEQSINSVGMTSAVLFVPGAWHGPEVWHQVATKVQSAGHYTNFVQLPSVGPVEYVKDLRPDVNAIRQAILDALEEEHKVILVMHSYGGVPGCEAAHGLDLKTRQAEGKAGGVVHLFFCCSFLIPAGVSMIKALGNQDAPWWVVAPDKLSVDVHGPEHIFYNDLPEAEAKAWAAKLKTQSFQTKLTKLKYASWQTIPSTYLYCEKDNALPLFVQKMMVEEFAKGVDIRTETLDASHSPFLSRVDETAASILRAVDSST